MNRAFGIVLREIMTEKKISRLKLVRLAKISKTSLYMIEKGKQSPTLDTIYMIAKGLDVKPTELISRAQDLMR